MRRVIIWFVVCLLIVIYAKINNYLPQNQNQVLGVDSGIDTKESLHKNIPVQ